MNECSDYSKDPLKGTRRVVCAAIRSRNSGKIICGARHYDQIMRSQLQDCPIDKVIVEQGFIDQWCNFMNREDALIVALSANQLIRTGGGFNGSCELFSENLY
jgi:hypothetical protein